MDDEDRGIILGELKALSKMTDTRLSSLEIKVDRLGNFKLKVVTIVSTLSGVVMGLAHLVKLYFSHGDK